MKKLITSLMLISIAALGASKPIITKSSGTGFTHPDWAQYEICEVFADRVEITRKYSGIETKETRAFTLTGDIAGQLAKLASENVDEKENFLCDGPSTTVEAGGELLYRTGGCGSPRKERLGPVSANLRNIVNTFCPVTHGDLVIVD